MNKLLTALLVLALFIFSPSVLYAANSNLPATADTYLTSRGGVNASYGSDRHMLTFYDAQSDNRGGIYIKFDFGGVFPEGTVINSAFVDLYQDAASGATPRTLTAHLITSDWNENVTWNTKPAIGAAITSVATDNTKQIRSWDITQTMRRWFDRSVRNYGLYISYDGGSNQSFSRTFSTREGGGVFQPVLRVDYTPPAQNQGGQNAGANAPVNQGFALPTIKPIIGNLPIIGGGINLDILVISNIKVENVTQNGATIKWQTSKNATSWVFYGNASDGSDRFDKQTGQNDSVGNHSINLANLVPNTKYSFKVMSKDINNNQAFGKITYFTTPASGQAAPSPAASPDPDGGNLFSALQDKLENKVADLAIDSSLTDDNIANDTGGSGEEIKDATLSASGPISLVAGSVGINKMAGVLLIILGLMSIVGALLLYKITQKVHHHIRRRLSAKK